MRWTKCLLALAVLGLGLPAAQAEGGSEFWISPTAAADGDGTQARPFVTLVEARDAIRAMRKQHGNALPAGGVTVTLLAGTYRLERPLELDAQDTGTKESPIVFRAAPGSKPVISGARVVANFQPWRNGILQADLRTQGLANPKFHQLFFRGQRQTLARYPNADAQNPIAGGWAYVAGKPIPMYSNAPNADTDKVTLQFKPEDVHAFAHPEEAEVFIFPRFNWWNNIIPIASIDREKNVLTVKKDASYAMRPGDRYFIQNALEELDAPGEWYLDPRTATLYFLPPPGLSEGVVEAPVARNLVQITGGASWITLQGLTFEHAEGSAIRLEKASDCTLAGNTVRRVGDYSAAAVSVNDGFRNNIVGNDIYDVGSAGIQLSSGDIDTLAPGECVVDNNHVHHTGVFYKQGIAISVGGTGNAITHNLIHDCPRFAVRFSGPRQTAEFNHVHHVCLETEDTGAFYIYGADWVTAHESKVRFNYIHDILGFGKTSEGKWVSPYYAWGIYLDDHASGVEVSGNILARCSRGGLDIHSGKNNSVTNNIFFQNGDRQMDCDGWTVNSAPWQRHLPELLKKYEAKAHLPAWASMPKALQRPDDLGPDGMVMTGNRVERNIFSWTGPKSQLYKMANIPFASFTCDYNLIDHAGQPVELVYFREKEVAPFQYWPLKRWQEQGGDGHSVLADPKFVDATRGDLRLANDSPAFALGFVPIPVEKIGLYASPLRASWPVLEDDHAMRGGGTK